MKSNLIFIFLLIPFLVISQSNKDNSKSDAAEVLNSFLKQGSLQNHLVCESCIESAEKITCDIFLKIQERGKITDHWWVLSDGYASYDIIPLEKRLFLIAQSASELPIILRISNNEDFNLYVYEEQSKITTKGSTTRSIDSGQGEIKDSFMLEERFLNNVILYDIYHTECEDENTDHIYNLLRDKFKSYYKSKNREIVLSSYYDPFSFVMNDVRNEILGNTFFKFQSGHEKITITIQLDIVDKRLKIGISIDARMASGLYKPSTKNGYWNMEEDYEEDVKEYLEIEIKAKIKGWLSGNN